MKKLTCAISTITLLLSGTTITPKLQKKLIKKDLKRLSKILKSDAPVL